MENPVLRVRIFLPARHRAPEYIKLQNKSSPVNMVLSDFFLCLVFIFEVGILPVEQTGETAAKTDNVMTERLSLSERAGCLSLARDRILCAGQE
jgi:hypothetical protein